MIELTPRGEVGAVLCGKFVVISFTRVDTCNEKYKAKVVWKQAVCRYVSRVKAYGEGLRRGDLRRDSRGSGRALSQRHREREWRTSLARSQL